MFNQENEPQRPVSSSTDSPAQPHPQISEDSAPPAIDEIKMQMLMNSLKENQNLSMGILGGFIAALAGASVWAIITAITEYQIGFMAIGVGFLVGYAVRYLGHGLDQVYGYIGGGLSLVGCLLGNVLTACIFYAEAESVPFMDVVGSLDFSIAFEILVDTFSFMDILFYGIAVYYGYKWSFRQFTEEEMRSVTKQA